MRDRFWLLLCLSALIAAAGCDAQPLSPAAPPPTPTNEPTATLSNSPPDARVAGLFGGEAALKAVLSARTATAYRIADMRGDADDAEEEESIGGYPVTAGPVPVDEGSLQELAAVFSDAGTYDWETAKGCIFQPGVAIRYADAKTTTDVLLCFSCDELMIYRNGERVGGEDFDNARGPLLAVAKRLFPDDAEIQKLK